MNKLENERIIDVVDNIGLLKAEIDRLNTKKQNYQNLLIDAGISEAEGKLFRVTISRFTRFNVNWKKIAEKLGYSRQLKAGNTTQCETVRVNVKGKLNPTG